MNRLAYDVVAPEWDALRVSLSEAEERLLAVLLELAPPGSRVLDLGCGTGRPIGEHMSSLGFALTGVDQSPRMLELARARLPDAEWVECAIEQHVPAGEYHAVIAWDSLFHIPREHHLTIFRRVRSVLPDGGRFLLTVGGSAHRAFTDTMLGQEFFYDSHAPETVVTLLADAGFAVIESEFLNLPTGGRDKGRVAMLARAIG